METLYTVGDSSKGGALWPISRLLNYFHGVKSVSYKGQTKGVCLSRNTARKEVSSKMRQVVFIGGYRIQDHGIPRKFRWNKVHCSVFQSEFLRKIAKSAYDIKKSCVIHLVGGAHGDPNMMIPEKPKDDPIENEIHFIMVAKWWKRFYKRFKQHQELFLNHILPKYPNSILHNFGNLRIGKKRMEKDVIKQDNIIYYKKTFHKDILVKAYKQSHIQLILTPFDAGPMMVNESVHYRVPFVCGNNSCAGEFLEKIDGVCGEVVNIDPQIKDAKHCKKYKPMISKKFYGRSLNNKLIMKSVDKIIENYPIYTSWNWTKEFNYKSVADQWMKILFG